MTRSGGLCSGLPDFPWDLLEAAKARAAAHPDGIVDLSIGTPVDPVPGRDPGGARRRRRRARLPADRRLAGAARRDHRLGARADRAAPAPGFGVLPTIGSKELVAWLPTLLGLGAGDVVVIPSVCYPTYEVGRAAGRRHGGPLRPARPARRAEPASGWSGSTRPATPTARCCREPRCGAIVAWARAHGVVVASDECYLSLGWESDPTSALAVCDGDFTGVLAVHSLSKRSNLAGYRAGFVAGDPALVAELLAVRKHAGMIVPAPVQAAMIAALGDETHVDVQKARYARSAATCCAPRCSAPASRSRTREAGLYLWARARKADCWSTVDWLAERGILAAPGDFYGPAGRPYVRIALTATDERVATARRAPRRLASCRRHRTVMIVDRAGKCASQVDVTGVIPRKIVDLVSICGATARSSRRRKRARCAIRCEA